MPDTVFCIYHRVDFDGQCSAAIVKHEYPDCHLIPYNYRELFPWSLFEDAPTPITVYMVDVSLPIKDMLKLAGMCGLVWIDHHKSKIEEAQAANFNPAGVRDAQFASCELTWRWFHGTRTVMPLAVHLLGRYDAWDHEDERVLPFQYYMRSYLDTDPENTAFWKRVFSWTPTQINGFCQTGLDIMTYQQAVWAKSIQLFGFETQMFGYRTLACNSLPGGSQLFTAHPDSAAFDLFVMFYWRDRVGWTISLYTANPDIDCGAIARRMGDGGHQSAAGYVVSVLPEELQQHH